MKIKLHKNLDKKIWDKNGNIYPKVSEMLLSIAWAYIDYIRNEYDMNIRNSDIADIFVFGSITQYFYDKKSDIDMCIVLNQDGITQKFPNMNIAKQLKLYYYDWAMVHICKIYGRKIDLNTQDMNVANFNGQYRSGPIYSLLRNEWVVKPAVLSKQELKKLEQQSNVIYKQVLQDFKTVKKNGFKLEEIQKLYSNIIASKKQSTLDAGDPIKAPTYIALRQIKHDGYIKKLQTQAIKQETKKYVLK
jgi:predicted nucleotidyltransferase